MDESAFYLNLTNQLVVAEDVIDGSSRDGHLLPNCLNLRIQFVSNTSSYETLFKVESKTTPEATKIRKNNYQFSLSENVQMDYCLQKESLIEDYISIYVRP